MEVIKLPVSGEYKFTHDIAFNFYGDKFACCSGNQILMYTTSSLNESPSVSKKYLQSANPEITMLKNIKTGDKDDKRSATAELSHQEQIQISQKDDTISSSRTNWQLAYAFENAHTEPVWKIRWAHPDFGNVIASCSEDQTVRLWCEVYTDKVSWVCVATFKDAKKAVTDIQFAPNQFGFRLAACDEDGRFRIYDLSLKDLSRPRIDEYCASQVTEVGGCAALAWNPTSKLVMIIAVMFRNGSLSIYGKVPDKATSSWQLLQHVKCHAVGTDITWSPNLCRPVDILVTAGEAPSILLWKWDYKEANKLFKELDAPKSQEKSQKTSKVAAQHSNSLSTTRRNKKSTPENTVDWSDDVLTTGEKGGSLKLMQTINTRNGLVSHTAWNYMGTVLSAASSSSLSFYKADDHFQWHLHEELNFVDMRSIKPY